MNIVEKIGWRVKLLRDPVAYLQEQPFFRCADDDYPLRSAFVDDAARLSVGEKLRLISPFGFREPLLDLLLRKRLRDGGDGAAYFEIGDTRIYYRVGGPIENEEARLKGALLIIDEAFARPSEFFSPSVNVGPGDVVLDLGGNIGTSALLFSRLVGPEGRVFSFEPAFGDVLLRNLAENGAHNVQLVEAAVSDCSGEAKFVVTDGGIDSQFGKATHPQARTVRVTTLDEFVEQQGLSRVDFIKMDIEGAEELAIRGAVQTIRRFRPNWSVASYHLDRAREHQHPKLVALLREQGYTVEERARQHIYAHWSPRGNAVRSRASELAN